MPSVAEVKALLERELNRTHPSWGGHGLEVERMAGVDSKRRAEIQSLGAQYGCHECNEPLKYDPTQSWIADHNPPKDLTGYYVRKLYPDWDERYRLYAQCQKCSAKQGILVKKIKDGLITKRKEELTANRRERERDRDPRDRPAQGYRGCLDSTEQKLLFPPNGIPHILGTRFAATGDQTFQIDEIGQEHGCHSCGTSYPAETYHADHTFPREYCTSYFEAVFALVGLPYPDTFELRPQCPACSAGQGNQGNRIREVQQKVQIFAKENSITVNNPTLETQRFAAYGGSAATTAAAAAAH